SLTMILQSLLTLTLLSIPLLYSSVIDKTSFNIKVDCDESLAMGECTWDNKCRELGYMCDSENGLCCPVVDYTQDKYIAGPALDGKCEQGFALVKIPGGEEGGECVNIISIPGVGNICPLILSPDIPTVQCEDWKCGKGGIENLTCFQPANICCPDQNFEDEY
ncbi:hypothetical protein PENTCL1PPCAC_11672, partial [Pristionchus entomophagus]